MQCFSRSSTSVTGLNNNEYQITRGKELNRLAGISGTCDFVKLLFLLKIIKLLAFSRANFVTLTALCIYNAADFMKMPFDDNTFDAVYAIEATCHAPDPVGCYKEIYRVLKPGQCFAVYEWCITDHYDPNNATHKRIKDEIELGNGLPDIRSTRQCLQAVKDAGFEVVWDKDLAEDSPLPWYLPLDPSRFSLSSFRLTSVGRMITRTMVKALEYVGLAPQGRRRSSRQCTSFLFGSLFWNELLDHLFRSARWFCKLPRSMSSSFRDQFLSCCVAGFQREKASGHFEEAEEREPGIKKTFSSPV
ncbi:sterol methyltransferase1 [Zea mays]|uniref:Methyltransferase n=1 Tax=Zea mays TaxID=4577 RepID=A0A1D6HVT3_MAIZE|nr:sterol methyltransferase1 [Zea mays]